MRESEFCEFFVLCLDGVVACVYSELMERLYNAFDALGICLI